MKKAVPDAEAASVAELATKMRLKRIAANALRNLCRERTSAARKSVKAFIAIIHRESNSMKLSSYPRLLKRRAVRLPQRAAKSSATTRDHA
jgi:hypothetical protein